MTTPDGGTVELKACPFCGGAPTLLARTCNKDTPYNALMRAAEGMPVRPDTRHMDIEKAEYVTSEYADRLEAHCISLKADAERKDALLHNCGAALRSSLIMWEADARLWPVCDQKIKPLIAEIAALTRPQVKESKSE